ncbi:ABC transporter permease [Leucobacter sp. HY1908]
MTTTYLLDGSQAPDPRTAHPAAAQRPAGQAPAARRAAAGAKLSFAGLLRSERIKLSSLRSVRFTLAATLIAGLGLSGLFSLLWVSEGMAGEGAGVAEQTQYLLMASSISVPFIALVFGVLGVLVMSSEYASGLILSTLVAAPRRGAVFAAKGIMLAVLALVTAAVVVVGSLLLAVAFDPATATQLLTAQVVTSALGLIAYLTLLALFAYGLATLTRNAAAGIGIVAGVTFVAPIALQVLMMTGWEWVPTVFEYLPTNLANVLSMGVMNATEASAMGATGLGYGGALAVMVAWAAVTVIPAAIVFKRRDAH